MCIFTDKTSRVCHAQWHTLLILPTPYTRTNKVLKMFGNNISQSNKAMTASIAIIAYAIMVAIYLSPAEVQYKISFPVLSLALFSFLLLPVPMSLAMLFSAFGDMAGAAGNFMLQLGFFAATHVSMIIFFTGRLLHGNTSARKPITYITAAITVALTVILVLLKIIPEAHPGILLAGVIFYTAAIAAMLFTAMLQGSLLYTTGACLFVISDLILAWNKFVSPVEYYTYLNIIPYYTGQLLLFIKAADLKTHMKA